MGCRWRGQPAAPEFEHRAALEWRASGRRLEGYAVRFGIETRIGGFVEKVARGAFDASLAAGSDVLALVDHDVSKLLARTRSGSLRLRSDADGLAFDLDLADTSLARDILALAERGDLGGMSFGFTVPDGGERWVGDVRELRSVDLREISVISSWPAYDGTTVAARARQADSRRQLACMRRYLDTL